MRVERMKAIKCGVAGLLLAAGGLGLAGCGNSNPNEREFLQNAPPGKPSEFPNESVAERKARTRGETKPASKDARAKAPAAPTR
jgi:hypothetical protein